MTEAVARPSSKWKIAAILLVVVGVVAYCEYEPGPIPFEREAWRSGERWTGPAEESPRLRMGEGLVRDRVLIGKQRAEIEEMLGPRADTSKFRDYDLVYWLGPERGAFGIDSEWLVVRLDAKGVATETSLVRD